MHGYAWLLLALPMLGFVLNGGLGRRLSKDQVALLGCGVIGAAFVVALIAYFQLLSWTPNQQVVRGDVTYYRWVTAGSFHLDFGLLIDPLSAVMLLVVTGVGFLIHVYSVGYMHEDKDFSRFFAYMNLFIFSMLMLVLADNFLFLLIGWGLVGLSSYLLIGFWYQGMPALLAARKALIMNVVGDVGMMLAAFLMFRQFGSLAFADVFNKAQVYQSGDTVITAICLLLLVAAVAKSAQLPLHTWLPDAMEGPTPVSALIHAATMVTAGVYLIARCHVLYSLSPFAAATVATVGAASALVAATIAIVQTDIKRVLAYSTMSQIGYMFLGVGVGAYEAGMFHLVMHAFFKAMLFMGAGSIIHALHGEQDLLKMGALRAKMPFTHAAMLVGVLAISGVPPLAGFWSKDEILAHVWQRADADAGYYALYVVGFLTAALTVFYMFRLYYLAFYGRSRVDRKLVDRIHEAPPTMTYPMLTLLGLTVIGGVIQIPWTGWLNEWLKPVFENQYPIPLQNYPLVLTWYHDVDFQWIAFGVLMVLVAGAWLTAYDMYHQGPRKQKVKGVARTVYTFLTHKWYFDELYNLLFERPVYALASFAWRQLDRGVIDNLVNGVARGVTNASDDMRPVESGYVRTYALSLFVGVVLVLVVAVSQR